MIGILGAYGNIGKQVIRILDQIGEKYLVKCGSRNIAVREYDIDIKNLIIEKKEVDLLQEASLKEFIYGCEILINCAGPSNKITSKVMEACEKIGCSFVDPGIGDLKEHLKKNNADIVGIYGAGATPGLSGLIPIWFGKKYKEYKGELQFYMGFLGEFTKSSAEDYLNGVLGSKENMGCAWKEFNKNPFVLNKKENVKLPLFKNETTIFPYFDEEAEYVARTLEIRDGEWYIAIDNIRIANAMRVIRSKYIKNSSDAIESLCSIAKSEMCGRSEYIYFIIQINTMKDKKNKYKTLVLSSNSPLFLTGATIVATVVEILKGNVEKGIRPLSEIKDVEGIINSLVKWNIIDLSIIDGNIDTLLEEEVGEI